MNIVLGMKFIKINTKSNYIQFLSACIQNIGQHCERFERLFFSMSNGAGDILNVTFENISNCYNILI